MAKSVFSVFLVVCVLSADPIFVQDCGKLAPGGVNLAPVSNNSFLAEVVPGSSRDFVQAAIAVQMVMREMSRISHMEGTEKSDVLADAYRKIEAQGRFPSGIDFRLMGVTPSFYNVTHLGGKDFLLPVFLKRSNGDDRCDLQLIVTTSPRNGMFPIRMASPDESGNYGTSEGKLSEWEAMTFGQKLENLFWEMVEFSEDDIDIGVFREFIRQNADSVAATKFLQRAKEKGLDTEDIDTVTALECAEIFNGMLKEEGLYTELQGAIEEDLNKEHREMIKGHGMERDNIWWFNREMVIGEIYPVKRLRHNIFERYTKEERFIVAARRIASMLEPGEIPEIESLSLKAWVALVFSKLYAFGDYRFVIDFMEKVKNLDNKKSVMRRRILNSPEILVLYVAAVIISPESGTDAEKAKQSFLDKHLSYFFRKMDFYSLFHWTDRERESLYDEGRRIAGKLADLAYFNGDEVMLASIVDEMREKTKKYPEIVDSLKTVVTMYSYRADLAKRRLRMEKAARQMAREAVLARGFADRAFFEECNEEARKRLELYVRRAVAYTTGTYERIEPCEEIPEGAHKISVPQKPLELGEEIVAKRSLPQELDTEVRLSAIKIVNSFLTHNILRSHNVAKYKVSEKTSVVRSIAENAILSYSSREKMEKLPDPFQFMSDNNYFKLFEHYADDYLSTDNYRNLEPVMDELPREFWMHGFDRISMADEFLKLGLEVPMILEKGTVMIFSEKVTFEKGLGALLGKLARSGIKIAVIATKDRQRGLIDAVNRDIVQEDRKIKYAATVGEVMGEVGASRYYYFKVEGDPDAEMDCIMTRDITGIVDRIIETIGALTGIVQTEKIEQLYNAARAFSEAA